LLWLKILATWYPARAPTVDAIVAGWRFARLAQHQEMNGVLDDGRVAQLRQEGRFGYEQYAASGYRLWGVDVAQAFDATTVQYVELLGERVPYDRRNLAFLTSEPFVLGRMEVGPVSAEFDDAVPVIYAVQRRRAQSRGVPTAVSEDAVDAPPWFVYDNVYYEGEAWRCVGHDGGPAPNRSALSAKAALGWWAIFPDAYSESLHAIVTRRLATPNGILPGIYEATDTPNRSLNVNTSAVVLESLLYRQRGGRAFLAGEPQPRGGG
jgi:hypothetical protein